MTKEDIIKPENLVAKKPTLMNDNPMHYCPGCSHGVVHKLVAEVIEEMGLEDKAIGISPVGCAVFIYNYIDIDWQEAGIQVTSLPSINPEYAKIFPMDNTPCPPKPAIMISSFIVLLSLA